MLPVGQYAGKLTGGSRTLDWSVVYAPPMHLISFAAGSLPREASSLHEVCIIHLTMSGNG